MGDFNLEMLHPELQARIMSQLPTPGSLHSLIRASPRFFQVFLDRKQQILSKMAMQNFHQGVLSDAMVTVKASQLGDPPSRNSVLQFLGDLPLERDVHRAPVLPINTAVALCRLHEDVDYFLIDFSKRSLRMLATANEPSDSSNPSPGQYPTHMFEPVLSSLEAGRLQRAFCRFETFCHLFAKSDTRHSDITVKEQSQLFLQLFPKWQIEEIACIRDHLVHRLCEVFDSMEDDFVQRELSGKNAVKDYSPLDRWDADDHWFSSFEKADQAEYMEHLLSLGLSFLRQVFQATGEERDIIIISNRKAQYRSFLSAALEQPELHTEANRQDETDYENGVTVAFGEDAINNCNEGWVWGNNFRPALLWASGSDRALRSRGYVFWDHLRLKSSGMLNFKPRDIVDDDLDETTRFDEPSVEERVEGRVTGRFSPESTDGEDTTSFDEASVRGAANRISFAREH